MRGYDLDLLRYLQVLIEEESVSASARRLKVSEPAMSRHLARLREVFRDPILVQSGRRMTASSFALGILDRVQEVVRAADSLIETRALANLHNMTPTFTVRANDLIIAALGLPLLSALRRDCPQCELVFAPEVDDPASDPLRHDSIDLYIGATDIMKPEIRRQTIFRDTMRALVRKDHPIFAGEITPETMVRYEYISVSRRGRAHGPIDTILRDQYGLTRRIAMVVPNYHAMVESMKDTDLILPLPGLVLDNISVAALGLAAFEFPLSLPFIEAFQAWHPRRDTDPVHRWFRETLFRVSRTTLRRYNAP
ncbi:LysR family transcriptional regulator [Acetobacter oeni]|uniref:Transcriptional regulator n=1 Tax=Acetobacter oeni TaxID=304077 RepID=A0A511XN87_9PROT|nr:LysR family transcriptional regulator [Acetobacter oeni]MBB3884270.1 DNA-binding transcriptional LysR family regulator [Acetobacter oeni]NHO20211.1 LysR family transcriptional regulator [Acetobacter oeni]GBR05641.1 LysR family transcriptional regulator [Acetobacter oeni LMG 21952]GEN64410.1 transcriptional regulator [Acetobacter oeni]